MSSDADATNAADDDGERVAADSGVDGDEADATDEADETDEMGGIDDQPDETPADEPATFVWNDPAEPEPPESEGRSSGADATGRSLDPERYLLAGETIVERHDVGAGWVAVTTHRLLVFDPDSEGRRFETVDRPNVLGVGTSGGGSRSVVPYAWRAGGYAVVLVGGGLLVRASGLQSLFTTTETGAPGVDGVLSILSLVGTLVGLLADLLFVAGGVAAVAAVALTAWYLRSRAPTLVVERAGDDDIRIRLSDGVVGERLADTIEHALADELAVGRSGSQSGN